MNDLEQLYQVNVVIYELGLVKPKAGDIADVKEADISDSNTGDESDDDCDIDALSHPISPSYIQR